MEELSQGHMKVIMSYESFNMPKPMLTNEDYRSKNIY